EAHRAGPPTGDELWQVDALLLLAAVGEDRALRAVRQSRVHPPGPVRLADHLADRGAERFGQPLAAVLGGRGEARPAGLDVLAVRFLEPGRRRDHAALVPGAALAVADAVERREHLFGELRRLLENAALEIRRQLLELGK